MLCSFFLYSHRKIHHLVQPLPKLHRVDRYIEMLIAIPTLGYLRSNK